MILFSFIIWYIVGFISMIFLVYKKDYKFTFLDWFMCFNIALGGIVIAFLVFGPWTPTLDLTKVILKRK